MRGRTSHLQARRRRIRPVVLYSTRLASLLVGFVFWFGACSDPPERHAAAMKCVNIAWADRRMDGWMNGGGMQCGGEQSRLQSRRWISIRETSLRVTSS